MDWDFRGRPPLNDPVEVVDYDARWPEAFQRERERLREVLGPLAVAIEHVGSTAVPGLAAKPVLDILVGARPFPLAEEALGALAALGYEYRGDGGVPGDQFFRTNPRTRHLRVVEFGSERWQRCLQFRDYLRDHPEVARAYEALKRDLASRFRDDRGLYGQGKDAFIEGVLREAGERRVDAEHPA